MKLVLLLVVGTLLAMWFGAVAGTWLGKMVFRWLEPDAPVAKKGRANE